MEVKLNKSNTNPFYGLRGCMDVLQASTSGISDSMLNRAWREVKDNEEHRKMFFSLLFSVGDITARQHNIFKGITRDSGGNANRQAFLTIVKWLWENNKKQFIKFLNAQLFNEYQCFDTLFCNRVQTKKGTSRVISVFNMLEDEEYRNELAQYIYRIINGTNPFNKFLVAKFLTPPRMSKRSGHKKMLPETLKVMRDKCAFLVKLSDLMGWEYEVTSSYANFKGYREWRRGYNGELESVLFSTKKILEFSKDEFMNWYEKLPAGARYRTKNRILYSKTKDCKLNTYDGYGDKWKTMQGWVNEWEALKAQKQKEQRILEEKVRQNQASDADKERLAKVKKEAKVNIGATNFKELYNDILRNNVDQLKLESFIQNKVNLPYNTLVLVDDSGSMSGAPFNFAAFIAAVCLCKNPDDDGRNMLGFFSDTGRFFSYIDRESRSRNRILRNQVANSIHKPFVDPTKSFMENYENINKFCHAVFEGGCTSIRSILKDIVFGMKKDPAVLDALKNYPVWTIISDGEFNSMPSPESSINDFMRECENTLGFRPFLICMDITNGYGGNYLSKGVEKFSGIDNLIYIPSNPAQIEQFLTNFKDMDVFDIYTPLQSLYRSNRYDLVRDNTL